MAMPQEHGRCDWCLDQVGQVNLNPTDMIGEDSNVALCDSCFKHFLKGEFDAPEVQVPPERQALLRQYMTA